jgi:hypothetical protein
VNRYPIPRKITIVVESSIIFIIVTSLTRRMSVTVDYIRSKETLGSDCV